MKELCKRYYYYDGMQKQEAIRRAFINHVCASADCNELNRTGAHIYNVSIDATPLEVHGENVLLRVDCLLHRLEVYIVASLLHTWDDLDDVVAGVLKQGTDLIVRGGEVFVKVHTWRLV